VSRVGYIALPTLLCLLAGLGGTASVGVALAAQEPAASGVPGALRVGRLEPDLAALQSVSAPHGERAGQDGGVPDGVGQDGRRQRGAVRTGRADSSSAESGRGPRGSVRVELFSDLAVDVEIDRREQLAPDRIALIGRVSGDPHSAALFVIDGAALAADVVTEAARYEVRAAPGGHVVRQIDPAAPFTCGAPHSGPLAASGQRETSRMAVATPGAPLPAGERGGGMAAASEATGSQPMFDGPPVTVDLLVVYTRAAENAAGGPAGMRSSIALAVLETNQALERSLVPHRFRLVQTARTNYVESGLLATDFGALDDPDDGVMDEVFALAESTQADVVSLVVERAMDAGGIASLMASLQPEQTYYRLWNANVRSSLSFSLPHELGHNASLFHDRDNSGTSSPLFPYGYGYRLPGKWSTIMAYQNCTTGQCPRIGNYSNPHVSRDGAPTGASGVADEARVLVQTLPILASLQGCRTHVTPSVTRIRVGAAPSTVRFDVETDTNCTWHASTGADWLTIAGAAGARSSSHVSIAVSANATGTSRGDAVSIAGRTIVIEQAACATIDTPLPLILPAAGGAATAAIAALPGCKWSIDPVPSSLGVTLTSPASGAGPGTIAFTKSANADVLPSVGHLSFRTGPSMSDATPVFFVQEGTSSCGGVEVSPATIDVSDEGGSGTVMVTAPAGCDWTTDILAGSYLSIAGGGGTGNGVVQFTVAPNPHSTPRTPMFSIGGRVVQVRQAGRDVHDAPPDPGVRHTSYLAEGATGAFFTTRLALLNPGVEPAEATLRFLRDDGAVLTRSVKLPARRRVTVTPESVVGLEASDFSTVVESTAPVVVDRTMSWDAAGRYGSHAETAVPSPSTTWYLAEGSTSGEFTLFYLLQNPNASEVQVTIKYLRPLGAAPILRARTLPPHSRTTIPVDAEGPELASTDLSAVITASAPIIVERSMYLSRPGQPFAAGHESIGVTTPSTNWFLAEGATGPFFDLFILIANPDARAAEVRVDYLLLDGRTLTKLYQVGGHERSTIWVDNEDIPGVAGKPLDNVAVSSAISSTNGVPIIVERAMWWPASGPDFWSESHNSPGARETGTRWAVAEGEVGGAQDAETYLLIANTSASDGQVRVTLCYEDGATEQRMYAMAPRSRANVSVSIDFPRAAGRRFGAIVESVGNPSGDGPAQIVVERAMYTSPGGAAWAAGTNALATRLP